MAIAPLKAIARLFLFKSREIKTGSSVGAAAGELWLAEAGIQHQPCNFLSLAHTAKLLRRFLENTHKEKDPLFDGDNF